MPRSDDDVLCLEALRAGDRHEATAARVRQALDACADPNR
jgi:hypothetical protein